MFQIKDYPLRIRKLPKGPRVNMMKRIIQITERCCEKFGVPGATPKLQRQIAERAFELWLERGFRNGSAQEDWLHARQELLPLAS
jgi:hypothetical protein